MGSYAEKPSRIQPVPPAHLSRVNRLYVQRCEYTLNKPITLSDLLSVVVSDRWFHDDNQRSLHLRCLPGEFFDKDSCKSMSLSLIDMGVRNDMIRTRITILQPPHSVSNLLLMPVKLLGTKPEQRGANPSFGKGADKFAERLEPGNGGK